MLYNSPAKWTVPLNFKETLDSFEIFEKHVLDFRYILINVFAYDEKELLELSNLRNILTRGEKAKINIARQMLLDGEDIDKIIRYTGLTKEEILFRKRLEFFPARRNFYKNTSLLNIEGHGRPINFYQKPLLNSP